VKIADFGISKRILADSASGLYSTVGTKAYCAPEILGILGHLTQYQEIPMYSSKVDMWSLGCVLFNISSQGQRVFSESDLVRYCDRMLPFNPRKLPHCLGDSGESLMKALLNVEPEQRPNATEALQHRWFIAAGTTVLNTVSIIQPKSQSLGRQNYNSFLDSTLSTGPPLHVDTVVEALGLVSSTVAVVQIAGSIAKLCGEYIADVKDGRHDIERLHWKATILHDVLEEMVEANDPKNTMSLNLSNDVVAAVDRCSVDLRALQEKLQPETRQKTMSNFRVRALKWPLSKVAVNDEVKTMEGYWTVFNAALQLHHWRPDVVVGVDFGMRRESHYRRIGLR
jgi:serine/threonine protein kinase